MGINLGALVGPLLTGLLQKTWGFHFGVRARRDRDGRRADPVLHRPQEPPREDPPRAAPAPRGTRTTFIAGGLLALAAVVVLVLTHVITADRLADIVAWISGISAAAYFLVILRSREVSPVERRRVYAFIPLFIASAVFWSLYQQQFTVVTIYSDKRLDRNLFGWEMPVSWVQSINPVFIIILAGAFAALWTKLGDRQPSTPVKFALGTVSIGVSFLLFIPMAGGGPNSAPLLGLVGVLLFFTVAELLLSPVGLSVATKLAPQKFSTQMVALFFLSVALGTAMSGLLSKYYSTANEVPYFTWLGLVAIGVGLVLAALTKPIRSLMSGVR